MMLCKGNPFELDSDVYFTDFADDMCILGAKAFEHQLEQALTGSKAIQVFGVDTIQKISKILHEEAIKFIDERKFVSIVNESLHIYENVDTYNIKQRLDSLSEGIEK